KTSQCDSFMSFSLVLSDNHLPDGLRAFSSLTLASVRSAFSLACSTHPSQQRNTAWSFSTTFTGVPIVPRGVPRIGHFFCCSMRILSVLGKSTGVDGRTATVDEAP